MVFSTMSKSSMTTRGQKKEEFAFFYSKIAMLKWDLDCWRWVGVSTFLTILKMGRDKIIHIFFDTSRAEDKWQGYLPLNCRFYWS
jgi:hypothetical protein